MARSFDAELVEWHGAAAWHFIEVPPDLAPEHAGFGRVPVIADVDGTSWATSVWRGKDGRWLLGVPARIRGDKEDGHSVVASIEVDTERI